MMPFFYVNIEATPAAIKAANKASHSIIVAARVVDFDSPEVTLINGKWEEIDCVPEGLEFMFEQGGVEYWGRL